jgi:hypothetical protein
MKGKLISRFLLLGILCLVVGISHASEAVDKALDAMNRGDYDAAYSMWVSLAEAGDDKAMVEVGLMHHQGLGRPVDYTAAMDWYLKAFERNGDALNNMGVMYKEGHGVTKNRKIAYLLFLTVHMEGMGNEETIMRANRNLRREIAELSSREKEEALCYTGAYLDAYVRNRGVLTGISSRKLRPSRQRKRIRDFGWWAPGEIGKFDCPAP